jgi:sortase (surface protein transpeptidase)
MRDWIPRHRRERPPPATYVLLLAAGVLSMATLWALSVVWPLGGSSPEQHLAGDADDAGHDARPDLSTDQADIAFFLRIPRFGVSTPVVELLADDERVLAPPSDPDLAGWWSQGAAPGDERGAVLLVGRAVDSGEAVFRNVPSLDSGDLVLVAGDVPMTYRVTAVLEMSPDELASQAEDLFDRDGPPRLVMVTYDGRDGDDEVNIVVTADAVDPQP